MDFISIDVETANADLSSICQIGVVKFVGGVIVGKWGTLVNPEDEFDPMNIYIHGITEENVKDAPILVQIESRGRQILTGNIVACHTPFDKAAISRAYQRYGLPLIECTWLDTARVSRRAWTQFAYQGYSLANVAED